jgi:hypothetical protein
MDIQLGRELFMFDDFIDWCDTAREKSAAANGRVDRNVMRPAACPFCGCEMVIRSNRDWHHLEGSHDDYCVFVEGDPTMIGPVTPEQLAVMLRDWNRRHNA